MTTAKSFERKISKATLWVMALLLAFLSGLPAHTQGGSLVPTPMPTPRQLGMAGEFTVLASNGLIQMKHDRPGHWSRTRIPVTGQELSARIAEARARGEAVIDLSHFDLISASRRVDSLRLLDETAWSALATIVAFQLDPSLASGIYRYIMVSDPSNRVLLVRSPQSGRITLETFHVVGNLESEEAFLSRHGLRGKKGYAFSVPELAPAKAGAERLLLRLENQGVARSALLEVLVARPSARRV